MFCLLSPESVVPQSHPIRAIKRLADEALLSLESTFDAMYAATGRPSIPPERLLKASLLMALYSVRSERQLCEQLDYNMLFRWFLDMDMVEPSFDHSTFTRNRERLLKHDVAGEFFHAVVAQARKAKLVSSEHFSADGTLIEAWASLKSFKKKDDDNKPPPPTGGGGSNREVSFHGEKRTNETHASTTDPESRLMRKGFGKEAKLSFSAHALMENRSGLLVDFRIAKADGYAEREVAAVMLTELGHRAQRITVGADKAYDTRAFVERCRALGVVPHVAQNQWATRRSALDARTTRHVGYSISQRIRKRIEEPFGWLKTVANFRKTRFRGLQRTQLAAYLNAAAYNLLRIARLVASPPRMPLPEAA